MKKKTVLIGCLIVLIWAVIVFVLYRINIKEINSIMLFISGFSTIGLFIITIFYVLFTGKQIEELEMQRMLQIQPYIEVDFKYGMLLSPRICYQPFDGSIVIANDLSIYYAIKNVGNGTAISVDMYASIFGKKITKTKKKEIKQANRITKIEQGESKDLNYNFRFNDTRIYDAINNSTRDTCPGSGATDIMLKFNILYRNIAGQTFKISHVCIIAVSQETQKLVDEWNTANKNLKNEFSEVLTKIKLVYNRNHDESRKLFIELKNMFYQKYNPKAETIGIFLLRNKTSIDFVKESERKKIYSELNHGIPIGKEYTEEEIKEIDEVKIKLVKKY